MKIEGGGVADLIEWPCLEIPKIEIQSANLPIKLDGYFFGSLGCSLFLIGLPTPTRIIANICQSMLFRAAEVVVNKKGFFDFFNPQLLLQIGATVLIGEISAKLLSTHGDIPSRNTPRMPVISQTALQFRSASYEVKTRMIEAAYYDKTTFESIMIALRKPEDFAWHHKSMIVHELRAVLTTFHPERAASLEANLATVAARPDIGDVYNRMFVEHVYLDVRRVLTNNFEPLSEIRNTPDFVGLLKTLIELG